MFPKEATVFYLRVLRGWKFEAIAEVVGYSVAYTRVVYRPCVAMEQKIQLRI